MGRLFSHYDFCSVKKATAIIFLLIFSLQTFYTASATLWFYANQGNISKKHCVNKYRPKLNCNGKCFLSKKIKAAEEKQEKETPFQVKQWIETAPCTISFISCSIKRFNEIKVHNPKETNFYNYISSQTIFHPPSLT